MAGLGGVGADERAVLIAVDHAVFNLAVEEYDGDAGVLGGIAGLLGSVGRRGLHDVHNQQIGAVGDGGVDLVQLSGLVAGAVIVVVGDAGFFQQGVHGVADGGDVRIGIVVIEHANVQLTGCGIAVSRSLVRALLAAAGHQGQAHDESQDECKKLLHLCSSC